MCVVNVSLITDYDSGVTANVEPVSHAEVMKVFAANITKLQSLLVNLIETIPNDREKCTCADTLKSARG
jgi:5'-methylthioadenosine phosphorylase